MYLEKILDNINHPVTKNDLFEQAKKSRKGQSAIVEEGDAVPSEMLQHMGIPDRSTKAAMTL